MKKSILFLAICIFSTNVAFSQKRIISQNANEMITQEQVTVTKKWTCDGVVGTTDDMLTSTSKTKRSTGGGYVNRKTGGNLGFGIHGGGVFCGIAKDNSYQTAWGTCNSGYIGGSIYYNFGSTSGISKFGLSAGYDYTFKNTINKQYTEMSGRKYTVQYHDLNLGIIICKYIGIGASVQLASSEYYEDWYLVGNEPVYGEQVKFNTSSIVAGPYLTLYLPVSEHFGLMTNLKCMLGNGENAMPARWSIGAGFIFQIPTNL